MDKPAGMTSHDVVARVRRLFGTRAVGHTGTLDPFATGLLVLVLGQATRLARFVEGERKTYRAVARLGWSTTTDDGTGEPEGPAWTGDWPTGDELARALGAEIGRRLQQPPRFSAKKVGGTRSYAAARQGETLAVAPSEVTVDEAALVRYDAPAFEFRAVVGPGTYLRAMARDVGARLGTGGHLTALRREQVGRFRVADATPVADLTGAEPLVPPPELVAGLERVEATEAETEALRHGRRIGTAAGSGLAAIVRGGALVAVAEPREGQWQPVVVLNP
ncbi:MAG: tRNA pseudouridine(55) synthase TruB [Gemmatimonadales bacterium]